MPTIACLHTATSNISIFDHALTAIGSRDVRLAHSVRPDLLAAASGTGLDDRVKAETRRWVQDAGRGADYILLTCSTLGPAIQEMKACISPNCFCSDEALVTDLRNVRGSPLVLVTAPGTQDGTRALFRGYDVHLIDGAWALFESGRFGDYYRRIADQCNAALEQGRTRIALAQTSMAPAAAISARPERVLTVPQSALRAALSHLNRGT